MLVALRVCRFCGRDEQVVRFYDDGTVAGRAAGMCCQPCWVSKSVTWRRANRERWNLTRHRAKLRKQFGITAAEYDALYESPKCAGCGVSRSANGRRLVLDHCHASGMPRGLLCHDCNRTIATAKDDPGTLRQLAAYLDGCF